MGTKNCPETGRQKMISMMYLVLTAMLALNVAAETLDAFEVVDESLIQTFKNYTQKNMRTYNEFDAAYLLNPKKVQKYYDEAKEVQERSSRVIDYISDLKADLAVESKAIPYTDGMEMPPKSVLVSDSKGNKHVLVKLDDLNSSPELMIRLERGEEFKQELESYRSFLMSKLPNQSEKDALLSMINLDDPKSAAGTGDKHATWITNNFESNPVIAVFTILSKYQIDVRNAESTVLSSLYNNIDAGSFKFNKLEAITLPKSSYVLLGDTYESEVMLTALDTTQQPEVYVNNKKIAVDKDGKVTYKVTPNSVGDFTWEGYIKFKNPEGNYVDYKFEQEYQVAAPTATISPTKMNVLYLGVPNPLSISAPGIATSDLEVTMSNGKVTKGTDSFVARPSKEDLMAKSTEVVVYAEVNGNRRLISKMPFRVKRVPDPVATVANLTGGEVRKASLQIQAGMFAMLKDFDFDMKFNITQFRMNVPAGGNRISSSSSTSALFTQEQKEQLKNLQTGSIIYFDQIKAEGDDGTVRDLGAISFRVR